jgi:hypothetical protein
MRFKNALNALECQREIHRDVADLVQQKEELIDHEDLQSLRSVLKQLLKQEDYDLPKSIKNIDALD